ncbi:glycosyltransferase family 9 protein [Arthrobacter sp. NPDC080031]|uniref:glycosyltransferase family 9 protein n=1 Tax=Arthrobacter sp. NPDC080031 TaxID=3155918 RepID=UPI00344FA7F9
METRPIEIDPRRFWPQAGYGDLFPDVRRIGVLRGGGLGDLIFALPAIAALSAAYPGASLTLLGSDVHRSLVAACDTEIEDVEVLADGWDGSAAPSGPGGPRSGGRANDGLEAAVARLRGRSFDLLVQLHGGGRQSNPFVHRLGAKHTVGCATPEAAKLERSLPYQVSQPEVLRWLEVASLAGAQPVVLEPVLKAKARPSARLRGNVPRPVGRREVVVVHPGASDPRRRWPAGSFAQVVAAVARVGYDVTIVGGEEDAATAEEIRDHARVLLQGSASAPRGAGLVTATAGRYALADVVSLLSHATAFLGNDSGPRHLAQALGCPTVAIFWGPNAINAAPFSRARHGIHLGWRTTCPVCGAASALGTGRCPHDVSYVDDVSPEAVYADLSRFLLQ